MNKYRPVKERLGDFRPVEVRIAPEELAEELKRCQDCGIPFCHASGCTLTNAIPEINAQALAGRWGAALATLLASSPFPEFTARVCPALCEGSCVQALHGEPVPCRQIEKEVVERGFAQGIVVERPPRERIDLKIAVIGSGPAGLAAAWRLNQAGAQVAVYERDARPGGFLRYGIPDFKLEKEVVDRRVDLLAREGIAFECGVEAGVDVSGRLLRRRFDALILATGARKRRDLAIPGRDLSGVCFATDFLAAQNRVIGGELASLPRGFDSRGRAVVVIGGGDTGSDCVGTSLRQGAASVLQLEIMPEPPERRSETNPWPEWPRVRRDSSSHEEGGKRRWSVTALRFLPGSDPGRLGGLQCAEVDWIRDASGRPAPVVCRGSEFEQPADMAILALGFTGVEESPLYEELGVKTGKLGTLAGDRPAPRTNEEGIYATGDAVKGPSLVVRAIADGLEAAETVLADHREGKLKKARGRASARRFAV